MTENDLETWNFMRQLAGWIFYAEVVGGSILAIGFLAWASFNYTVDGCLRGMACMAVLVFGFWATSQRGR